MLWRGRGKKWLKSCLLVRLERNLGRLKIQLLLHLLLLAFKSWELLFCCLFYCCVWSILLAKYLLLVCVGRTDNFGENKSPLSRICFLPNTRQSSKVVALAAGYWSQFFNFLCISVLTEKRLLPVLNLVLGLGIMQIFCSLFFNSLIPDNVEWHLFFDDFVHFLQVFTVIRYTYIPIPISIAIHIYKMCWRWRLPEKQAGLMTLFFLRLHSQG